MLRQPIEGKGPGGVVQAGYRESVRLCELGVSHVFVTTVWVFRKVEKVDQVLYINC